MGGCKNIYPMFHFIIQAFTVFSPLAGNQDSHLSSLGGGVGVAKLGVGWGDDGVWSVGGWRWKGRVLGVICGVRDDGSALLVHQVLHKPPP